MIMILECSEIAKAADKINLKFWLYDIFRAKELKILGQNLLVKSFKICLSDVYAIELLMLNFCQCRVYMAKYEQSNSLRFKYFSQNNH